MTTWEVKEGSNFVNATQIPTASDDSIIILTGHTITVNVPIILDQVLVQPGASLIVANQLTVNDGPGVDILFSNGTSGRFANATSRAYQLWPDPVTDVLNLKSQRLISRVQCFAGNGQLVFDQQPASNECRIKVDKWAAGIYQLKIILDGEVIMTKFTKQ